MAFSDLGLDIVSRELRFSPFPIVLLVLVRRSAVWAFRKESNHQAPVDLIIFVRVQPRPLASRLVSRSPSSLHQPPPQTFA